MQSTCNHVGPESFLTPEVIGHVESVARSMIGRSGFCWGDLEDLIQEFYLQITRAADKFDPAKSTINTYACRVVDRHRNYIFRSRIAKHADIPSIRLVESQDEDDDYGTHVADDLAENSVDKAMLCLDVRAVVATLPEKHRVFCEAVMSGDSFRVAARKAGFATGNMVANYVLPFLRKKFKKAGISEIF